jgi:hypothetical protein
VRLGNGVLSALPISSIEPDARLETAVTMSPKVSLGICLGMLAIWRDSLCAPQKALFGAIQPLRAIKRPDLARFAPYAPLTPFDWRDSSQSCGGERNLPSPPTWTRLPSTVFFE